MNKFPPNVHIIRRLRYLGDISQALEKPGRNFTQVGEAPTWKILSHHVEFYTMYTLSLNGRSFNHRLKLNLIIYFSSHFHSLLLPLQTHPAVFLNARILLRTSTLKVTKDLLITVGVGVVGDVLRCTLCFIGQSTKYSCRKNHIWLW